MFFYPTLCQTCNHRLFPNLLTLPHLTHEILNLKTKLKCFKFPFRSKRWIHLSRRADLVGVSPEYLNANVKICSKHFESSQFKPDFKPRLLKRDAVPTLFDVPNPPAPVTIRRALTTRQMKPAVSTHGKTYFFPLPPLLSPSKVTILCIWYLCLTRA